jgi:tetratricopeptide (TPR) repeat protein
MRPVSVIGLSFACILLTVVGSAAWGGYQAGLAQRESQLQATQAVELKLQYDLGVTDLAAGRYTVAVERFQYILKIYPDYSGVAEKLAQAQSALHATATPPRSVTPAASATGPAPARIFALAQHYYLSGDWNAVINQLVLLDALDPNYESVKADGLLFVALRNRGLERILDDEMEAGIFDLDQAEAFGPLDGEAANYRAWARLYLAAQSYWGVNWEQTVEILQQLYVLAPNFHDTSHKLYQATVKYAAQLAAAGDACGAAEQYAAAQTLFTDQGLMDAQATAQAGCLITPTLTPTP